MKIDIKSLKKIYGMLILIEGLAMLPSGFCGIYFNDIRSAKSFLITGVLCILSGFILSISERGHKADLKPQEGYFVATTSWIIAILIGTVPTLFAAKDCTLINAVFESVSSFTTTGCSTMNIDDMPKALLLWEATSSWLGGMGILVLVVSVFPVLGLSGQHVANAEITGPVLQKIGGKYANTGRFLYLIYFVLTALEFALLSFSGMGEFNALINSFTSISTGGLLITSSYRSMFASGYVRTIITLFTFLSSLNFMIYYYILAWKFKAAVRNYELRIFAIIIGVATIVIFAVLLITGTYSDPLQAIGDVLCQVVSFASTSGYYVCDYNNWPPFAVIILFTLLFIGGCSMSTTGSLKVIRFTTLFKVIKRGIFVAVHPNAVKTIIIDGKPMQAKKASEITAHIILFFITLIAGNILLSLNGLELKDTITATIAMFTNAGLSLGEGAFSGFFNNFNWFSKIIMCVLMLAGRLEMYSLFIVFTKSYWKPDEAKKH